MSPRRFASLSETVDQQSSWVPSTKGVTYNGVAVFVARMKPVRREPFAESSAVEAPLANPNTTPATTAVAALE